MTPRLKVTSVMAASFLAILGGPRADQESTLPVQPLGDGLRVIAAVGGNVTVSSGSDGRLQVDGRGEARAEEVDRIMGAEEAGPLRFGVLTSWRDQHRSASEHSGGGAAWIAHENARRRLAGGPGVRGAKAAEPRVGELPALTFRESLTLHLNGEEILLLHLPSAHSDGDVVAVFTGSRVAHLGDLYWSRRFPPIDLESGGSVDGLRDAISAILASLPPDTQVVPGRGVVTRVAELREYLGMLNETRRRVADALKAGKTVPQMRKAGLLGEFARPWGEGLVTTDAWLECLAKDLTRRR